MTTLSDTAQPAPAAGPARHFLGTRPDQGHDIQRRRAPVPPLPELPEVLRGRRAAVVTICHTGAADHARGRAAAAPMPSLAPVMTMTLLASMNLVPFS